MRSSIARTGLRGLRATSSALLAQASIFALTAGLLLSAANVPRPAPSLTVNTLSGRTLALEDLRGKVVVVMVFSTDCPHCQETTRILNPIYSQWRSRGLEILGLAVNPSAETKLKDFAVRFGVKFPLAVAGRMEWARLGAFSITRRNAYVPHLLFVDRSGVIRADHPAQDKSFHGDFHSNFRAIVDRLLKEPVGAAKSGS